MIPRRRPTHIDWQDLNRHQPPTSKEPLLFCGLRPDGDYFVDVRLWSPKIYDEHLAWGVVLHWWAELGEPP